MPWRDVTNRDSLCRRAKCRDLRYCYVTLHFATLYDKLRTANAFQLINQDCGVKIKRLFKFKQVPHFWRKFQVTSGALPGYWPEYHPAFFSEICLLHDACSVAHRPLLLNKKSTRIPKFYNETLCLRLSLPGSLAPILFCTREKERDPGNEIEVW